MPGGVARVLLPDGELRLVDQDLGIQYTHVCIYIYRERERCMYVYVYICVCIYILYYDRTSYEYIYIYIYIYIHSTLLTRTSDFQRIIYEYYNNVEDYNLSVRENNIAKLFEHVLGTPHDNLFIGDFDV